MTAAHDPGVRASAEAAVDRALIPPFPPDETPVRAENVDWAVEVVARTGLVPEVEEWTRRTTGRPQTEITVEAVLVSLLLLAVENKPLLLNNVEALAYRRVPADARERFRTNKPTVTEQQRRAAYKNVRDQFHRICRSMDPSPLPKGRRLLWDELRAEAERNALTPADETEMYRRLRLVTARLLQATFEMLPRHVRRRWKGSVAIDGTKVPVFAVGRDYDGVWESTDPDAGWHTRTKGVEHHGIRPGERPPGEARGRSRRRSPSWAPTSPSARPRSARTARRSARGRGAAPQHRPRAGAAPARHRPRVAWRRRPERPPPPGPGHDRRRAPAAGRLARR